MSGRRRDDDPEIAGLLREREAREERIAARMPIVFVVLLLASALLALKGSADVCGQWRSAAHVAIDGLDDLP